jgi:polysaccharide biosynthesis/export protein
MPTRLAVLVTFGILAFGPVARAQAPAGGSPPPAAPAQQPPQAGARDGAPPAAGTSTGAAPAQQPAQAATRAGAPPAAGSAPTAGPASPGRVAAAALPADYRLAIGDKLRVEVYKDAQLSQSLQVRPDGKITLPLIGDLTASGLTSLELRDQIANSLKEYVTNPVVTVIVVETVPPVVYVMGEVTNPGAVPLNGPMSVLQALAMAGGFRDFANTKSISVLRRSARGVQTISFNYKAAVKGEGNPVMLQPGDTVVVP